MLIHAHEGGIFHLDSTFAEKALPKTAGWRFHGMDCYAGCKACQAGVPRKVWWTDRESKVIDLLALPRDAGFSEITSLPPDLIERLQGRAVEQAETREASRAVDAAIEIPRPEGLEYLGFQRAGVAFIRAAFERGMGVLVADEQGLGKTVEALGTINLIPEIHRTLVVVPASLKINWSREAAKWLVRPTTIKIVDKVEDLPAPNGTDLMVITNYDRLVGKHGQELHAALRAQRWDLMLSDEAHFLKNPKSQRTIAVLGRKAQPRKKIEEIPGLAQSATRCAFMTGTPILNRPAEAHALLATLDPTEFGNFFTFGKRYCAGHQEARGRHTFWDFTGASHLDELQTKLRSRCMVRRLKSEVLTELPPKRRQLIVLEPDAKARKLIARECELAEGTEAVEAEADMAHAAGDQAGYAAAVARLEQATTSFAEIAKLRHDLAVAKVPAVIEHIDGMLEDGCGKLLVWAHHHDVVDLLMEHFGAAAVEVTGRTSQVDRQAAVDRFQADPAVTIFVGNIKAAGVGLTLTAASNEVFAELDWVPANVSQAEDRAHRIGQVNPVLVQHLVFDGSLDARIAAAMVARQEIADKALDRAVAAVGLAKSLGPRAGREGKREHTDRPETYPAATQEQRAAAALAMGMLAGRCDGARSVDGAGFSKIDTHMGHRLAEVGDRMTDGQVWLAAKLARRYQRQLPGEVLGPLGINAKGTEEAS